MQNFLSLLSQHPWVLYSLTIILGLCVGSFLNVVIYRLPLMLQREWTQQATELLQPEAPAKPLAKFNLHLPASHCPYCQTPLKPWHNIPVLSFLVLRGKCYYCRHSISMRYPAIEILTAILSLLVILKFGVTWQSLAGLVFCWSMISLTFIDIDHQLLPDTITLPLLWVGLLININHTFTSLPNAVASAAAAYMTLWVFIKLFYWITGKIGMGEGDFKLFAVFGAWFGWQLLPLILVMSSLLGAVIGIGILTLTHKSKDTPIPFGPFLALAGIIGLLGGNQLIDAYVGLMLR